MRYKTSELTGALLNAAVAKAEGLPVHPGPGRFLVAAGLDTRWAHEFDFLSWNDAGPLIERDRIDLVWLFAFDGRDTGENAWSAFYNGPDEAEAPPWIDTSSHHADGIGDTPVIAAMRALVQRKLGTDVELE